MNTVEKDIKISGLGVHSGAPANMIIKPSLAQGIFFKRTDLNGDLIPATYDNVGNTALRNTTVGTGSDCVQTIEHLMAALSIAGIDSCIIEIDGPEIPILDGSAKQFCELLKAQSPKSKQIIVKKEIVAKQSEIIRQLPLLQKIKLVAFNILNGKRNDGYVKLSPSNTIAQDIYATLVYQEPIIGTQSFSFVNDFSQNSREKFIKEIASARTFGKFSEWEYLKARGMARGCNEINVIVLNNTNDGTMNPAPYGLYYPDEFVRHKIIDVIGDMWTAGGYICGRIESYKGSHSLNNLVLRKLFSDPGNYDIVTSNQ